MHFTLHVLIGSSVFSLVGIRFLCQRFGTCVHTMYCEFYVTYINAKSIIGEQKQAHYSISVLNVWTHLVLKLENMCLAAGCVCDLKLR